MPMLHITHQLQGSERSRYLLSLLHVTRHFRVSRAMRRQVSSYFVCVQSLCELHRL